MNEAGEVADVWEDANSIQLNGFVSVLDLQAPLATTRCQLPSPQKATGYSLAPKCPLATCDLGGAAADCRTNNKRSAFFGNTRCFSDFREPASAFISHDENPDPGFPAGGEFWKISGCNAGRSNTKS